jgi:hypothetical protein
MADELPPAPRFLYIDPGSEVVDWGAEISRGHRMLAEMAVKLEAEVLDEVSTRGGEVDKSGIMVVLFDANNTTFEEVDQEITRVKALATLEFYPEQQSVESVSKSKPSTVRVEITDGGSVWLYSYPISSDQPLWTELEIALGSSYTLVTRESPSVKNVEAIEGLVTSQNRDVPYATSKPILVNVLFEESSAAVESAANTMQEIQSLADTVLSGGCHMRIFGMQAQNSPMSQILVQASEGK